MEEKRSRELNKRGKVGEREEQRGDGAEEKSGRRKDEGEGEETPAGCEEWEGRTEKKREGTIFSVSVLFSNARPL